MPDSDESYEVSINQGLYQNAEQVLLSNVFGTRISDAETKERKDTGVQSAVEEIANLLSSGRLVVTQPITIHARTNGQPVMKIIYENGMPGVDGQPGQQGDSGAVGAPGDPGPAGPSGAIQVVNAATGEMAQFGIGLQNLGIVSNEFVPWPPMFLNPETANQQLTNQGGGQGPTGVTGYAPAQQGFSGRTGTGSGTNYGGVVGQGIGWTPLYQQGVPGVPPSSAGSGPTFPFSTGPLGFGLWYQYFGQQGAGGAGRPPVGGSTTGYTGTLTVVTDVSWDEDTCEMTKTTSDLEYVDGLLKSVS